MTGRRRFISVTPKEEIMLGKAGLDQVIAEHGTAMLSPGHPMVQRVQRIVDRLLAAMDPKLRGSGWRVHVIMAPSVVNAMVLPTGDIFVFTGILPVAKDDAGLAAILGHEVSRFFVPSVLFALSGMIVVFNSWQSII
jgi:predicted Zn-dependent protease